jgi:hypothetical protein
MKWETESYAYRRCATVQVIQVMIEGIAVELDGDDLLNSRAGGTK